jgi:streptogramin lyase
VPIERSRPYGIIADRFEPVTGEFTHFKITDGAPTNIRRPGVDSKNNIWISTWGSRAMSEGALCRLTPSAGAVMEREIGIPYANP